MATTFRIDSRELHQQISGFVHELTVTHFVDAMKKGGQVYVTAYRNILLGHKVVAPPGNTGIPATQAAAMSAKVGRFEDGTGVWLIVGPSTAGGRLRAPQLQFGEAGTKDRYTKLGEYRGRMPAYHWLQNAAAAASAQAQDVILKRLAVLVNRN